jgi:hypothetical protein
MSEHLLIAPEGDSSQRRHAHADCVARARAAGTFKTLDDWRPGQPHCRGRLFRLPWRRQSPD